MEFTLIFRRAVAVRVAREIVYVGLGRRSYLVGASRWGGGGARHRTESTRTAIRQRRWHISEGPA